MARYIMLAPKLRCIILGSGGLVSQRLQQRLYNHPFFDLVGIVGSPNSIGRGLRDLAWHLDEERPLVPDITIMGMEEGLDFVGRNYVKVIFSSLPSEVAAKYEPMFVDLGCMVYSNASQYRMNNEVPLVIPEVNANHLNIQDVKRSGIVCSTNCTVMPVALSIKPIHDALKINKISIRTEQSVSGGGLGLLMSTRRGIQPPTEIPGEAMKIEEELIRLLSDYENGAEIKPQLTVDVICKRVAREFGHIVHIEIETESDINEAQVIELWKKSSPNNCNNLPSSPPHHIIIKQSIEPEEDRWAGSVNNDHNPSENLHIGMPIIVTNPKISEKKVRWSAFSENTIRGAAGGCVLVAEMDSIRRELIPLSYSGEGYNQH